MQNAQGAHQHEHERDEWILDREYVNSSLIQVHERVQALNHLLGSIHELSGLQFKDVSKVALSHCFTWAFRSCPIVWKVVLVFLQLQTGYNLNKVLLHLDYLKLFVILYLLLLFGALVFILVSDFSDVHKELAYPDLLANGQQVHFRLVQPRVLRLNELLQRDSAATQLKVFSKVLESARVTRDLDI